MNSVSFLSSLAAKCEKSDFTFIDDIIEGVTLVLDKSITNKEHQPPYNVYNIGNNNPVDLMDYIKSLEKVLGKTAQKEFLPLQPGDVQDTYADVKDLVEQFGYKPSITVEDGITKFINWYHEYYKT